jgi:hypothetical protein
LIARTHPVLAAAVRAAGGAALFAAVDAGLLLTYLLSESDKSPVVLVASPSFCAAWSNARAGATRLPSTESVMRGSVRGRGPRLARRGRAALARRARLDQTRGLLGNSRSCGSGWRAHQVEASNPDLFHAIRGTAGACGRLAAHRASVSSTCVHRPLPRLSPNLSLTRERADAGFSAWEDIQAYRTTAS